MSAVPSVVLGLGGLAFLGFGMACALLPARMAAPRELTHQSPTARVDFLATYGGFQIGFGMFLLASAVSATGTRWGLWAVFAALAGFASLRALGIVLTRANVRRSMWLALSLEIGGASLAAWALGQ